MCYFLTMFDPVNNNTISNEYLFNVSSEEIDKDK
jgi:hypothetical protein